MKKPALLSAFTTTLLILLCLILIVAVWITIDLQNRAERSFGLASPKLAFIQRLSLTARLLLAEKDLTRPLKPTGSIQVFTVEPGESPYSITARLEKEGLVSNGAALRDYLVYSGLDTTIQAGEFELSPKMSAIEIVWALQDATPTEVTFHILPGWRMEEIADALPTSGLEFTRRSLLDLANQPAAYLSPETTPLLSQLPPDATLEGFLYPDSYRLPRIISVQAFIKTLLDDFQLKVDRQLQDGFQRQGLSLYQAVTLASIIQREAVLEEEMPMIASVFYNRLNSGMSLDTDPTVQYALGYDLIERTWWKNPLSLDDLQVNSSYNTYLHPGLPPGPISNPGLSALKAVAFPAQTGYFYFRMACDNSGRHNFAVTFKQHQQNACP
jgi:peptidoglycan lytic transglycosylase G